MVREIDKLVQDSRLAPSGDGHSTSPPQCSSPSSGQKWWLAILFGILFFLFTNSATLQAFNYLITGLGGGPLMYGSGPTLGGSLFLTAIYIGVFRLILW